MFALLTMNLEPHLLSVRVCEQPSPSYFLPSQGCSRISRTWLDGVKKKKKKKGREGFRKGQPVKESSTQGEHKECDEALTGEVVRYLWERHG